MSHNCLGSLASCTFFPFSFRTIQSIGPSEAIFLKRGSLIMASIFRGSSRVLSPYDQTLPLGLCPLSTMPYKLSASLAGHTSDVRALSTPADDLILSASRDSTAIVWRRDSAAARFASDSVFHASTRYVNSVTYLPPTAEAPKAGYAVTGDQDGVINVYSLEPTKDDPDYILLGHTNNVCGLRTTAGGNIISCSWDYTARVWKNFNSEYELKGHENSVWDVLAVNEDEFITASADKTIKLWKQHKVMHTFPGHNAVVRSLALIPDIGFASCADNEIRVWSLGGDLVYTLTGHTSFIYQLAVLPNGDLVSSSEDRSVRVWKDGECVQVLVHPAISVWTVSTLPNGDIVSGSSDKIVRIFSASEERWAPVEEIKAYDDVVAQQSLASHDVEQVKVESMDALNMPGKKVGQTMLVSNGDVTEVYHWDGSVWQRIGERAEGPSNGEKTKTFFEGKEYDYVWNVALEDGEPALKLPYNVSENPAAVAQRFLERNGLPLSHVNTIVEYIYQNTPGQTPGGGGEQFVDPYTGASRYQSSGGSAPAAPASSFMDPYTGASRYMGTPAPAAAAPASSYQDPYTGASRYSGASQPAPAKPAGILPIVSHTAFMLQPVLLKEGNLVQMRAKLHQYNDGLQNEISTSSLAFYPEEDRSIDEAFAYVQKCAASKRPTNPLGEIHVESVVQVLERWPTSLRLPVLDLARLIVAYCPEAVKAPGLKERLFEGLFKAVDWKTPWVKSATKPAETNVMLVLRALANVTQEGSGAADGPWLGEVLKFVSNAAYSTLTPSQRKPLATMLLNVSCVTLFTPLDTTSRGLHLSMIFQVLEEEKTDSESVYRALVGLGNVVSRFTLLIGTLLTSHRSMRRNSKILRSTAHRPRR
ncbi:phospholipase A-2-activating protein [Mycena maculata]|uniref:Phospholipase A-2-activating protein n=1 Tax=Mycena maculata TaxID=230809 RepID=A0AAD7MXM5_9AGAR|nr:phospholipase A-2-activating protein [Mycena maculata]